MISFPALNETDVYIWYRSTTLLDGDAVKTADQNLANEERNRRDKFQFEADRRDFTIAHDLLRRALSRHADVSPADWRFVVDDYGKPSIASADPQVHSLSFSLSHGRGCVACAVSTTASLGVDLERIDQSRHVQDIADRYFTADEAAWLRRCSDTLRETRFAELWVLKEAFLKAVGVGLSRSPASVPIRFGENGRIEFPRPAINNFSEWHFAMFQPVSNVRLGVAIRSAKQPRFFMRQDEGDEHQVTPIAGTSRH